MNRLAISRQAIKDETNAYVADDTMKQLACLALPSLPESAVCWITESFDIGDRDSREFVHRFAAIQFARSSPTEDAFEALLIVASLMMAMVW